ncbi:glycoside hydrolase family 2 protein [Candidatus Latescibacterota bacterium]
MKLRSNRLFFLILFVFTVIFSVLAHADRTVINLSENDWGLYRDMDAEWVNDNIYMPPVDISALPVNPPSCGWDALQYKFEKTVHLPATVEEHFWGDNGNNESVAGDYRGVTWWVTTFFAETALSGKRIFLDFESVHLRAEIFVNRTLTGYDTIGHTPFSVDITDAVRYGEENEIALRITDPLGNFSWNDRPVLKWGTHDVPAVHGFGGITGNVFLRAVEPVYINDIYVKNKPAIKEVDLVLTVKNLTGITSSGKFGITVYSWKNPDDIIWEKTFKRDIASPENEITFTVKASKAEIWDIENPNLYVAKVVFVSSDGAISDTMSRRFGFRWFDIGKENGDQRLYLNGKRIFLRGGMSWGFWPMNGVFPTREMAIRDVEVAKKLGLNYMNFHRAIGQKTMIEVSDEMGFLTYEESGGYSCENADQNQTLWREWRKEKLFRMVKRDRSNPSMIIYNLQNRTPNELQEEDIQNMKTVHTIDPTRIITYISGFWKLPPKEYPTKLFFKPNDFTEYYSGWFDMHNHTGPSGYIDGFYNGSTDYMRYSDNTDEVVFWGEDGGIYGPPRLQLIKAFHDRNSSQYGWQGQRFIEWHDAYDEFLDRNGFRKSFPDVDAFTVSIGNTTLYYHGRIIENIRTGNVGDTYTINGWAAPHVVNQAQIADLYRNPVGDPDLMARYCEPLYVAVKLRDKLVPKGSTVTADFYVVNEVNLRGRHTLSVALEHENYTNSFNKTFEVTLQGGEEYGQFLVGDVEIPLDNLDGYFTVNASLSDRNGTVKASGSDDVFAVDIYEGVPGHNGAVVDTSGIVNRALEKIWGFTLPSLTDDMIDLDYIVIGRNNIRNIGHIDHIMECVANGATAVVLAQADNFAELLTNDSIKAVDYRGRYPVGSGNFIAGTHELLNGLPQAQAFNWEYQTLYSGNRSALRLYDVETIVAAVSSNVKEVGTALTIIPYGRGRIILSTLNILPELNSDAPQSVTAKRLFMNFIQSH